MVAEATLAEANLIEPRWWTAGGIALGLVAGVILGLSVGKFSTTLSPELRGVIIGGAVGVVTTIVGSVFNWIQYRSQQRFGLRQGVYIEAVAALGRAVEYFTSVGRIDLDDSQLAQMLAPASVATNKMHVVGTQETIDALNKTGETLALSVIEMAKGRIGLQGVLAKLAAAEAEVAQSTAYLQQLGSMIADLPKSAATPQVLGAIPGLVVQFTAARDRVQRGQAQLDAARRERVALQKALFLDGLEAALKYQQELLDVNIAARRELGLPLNEAKYRSGMKKSADRMRELVQRTIKELEAGAGVAPPRP